MPPWPITLQCESHFVRQAMTDDVITDLITAIVAARADGDGVLTIDAVRARLTEAKLYVMRMEDEDFNSWWDRPLRHVRYCPANSIVCGGVTEDARALELYQLAQSVVDAKGRIVVVGLMAYKEYRGRGIAICNWPSTGHREVWQKHKVLVVNREHGDLNVRRYVSGKWEGMHEEVAG
jgi:hypothetical protein